MATKNGEPDFYGPGGVARSRKPPCDPNWARRKMLEARERGVKGIYVVDNGYVIATAAAIPHIFAKKRPVATE